MYINLNNSLHTKFSLLCDNSSNTARNNSSNTARNPQQEHREREQNSPLLLEGANGDCVAIAGGLDNINGKCLPTSGPPTLPPTFCSCGITMEIYQKEVHLTANTKLAYSK